MTSRGYDPRQSPGLGYKRVVSCKDSFHGTDVLAVSEHGAPGRRPNIHAHFVGRQREDGHGGKAKNDKIDAHKIAVLVRGGMLPMAYVYPREMRATRDLLRRRWHFTRKRAELLTHIQTTASQYLLPTLGKIAYHGNRAGGRRGRSASRSRRRCCCGLTESSSDGPPGTPRRHRIGVRRA